MNLSSFLYLKFWFHKIHPSPKELAECFCLNYYMELGAEEMHFCCTERFFFSIQAKKKGHFSCEWKREE